MKLAGKVALITGGASGLGAATAQHLTALGVQVAILDRQESSVVAMAETLGSLGIVGDVVDEASIDAALNQVIEALGALHIVVNCAGIAPAGRIVGRDGPMEMTAFHQAIAVNLTGTFQVLRAAASQMMTQAVLNPDGERGIIINTASVAAYEGQIGQAAYSASKGGVVSLALPAAREFGPHGIRVMTIAPGLIETPMVTGLSDEYVTRLTDNIPFPQRLGLAEEYAACVKFLIENTYMNGSVLRLDGGLRMPSK